MFTKAFWLTAFESAVTTFAATFAGSQVFIVGPSEKGFIAAGTAAAMAALYQFVKTLGASQSAKSTLKVEHA